MKTRCTNPKVAKFKDYGARGITICPQWMSFTGFLADMGEAPPGLTLERDDVNGNYEPSNCRWAARMEQAQNKRTRVSVDGELMTKKQAAKKLGLHPGTIHNRLRRGYTLEQAVSMVKGEYR